MGLKLTGSVTVSIEIDGIEEVIEISASEFSVVEDDMRHIGDGDYQQEVLYIYYGDAVQISFQATNFDGDVSVYPYETEGDIEIINYELIVEGTDNEDLF